MALRFLRHFFLIFLLLNNWITLKSNSMWLIGYPLKISRLFGDVTAL